jgi:hypothetical protein
MAGSRPKNEEDKAGKMKGKKERSGKGDLVS